MNGITREIAQFLSISLDDARKVQDFIEEWFDIDYSEATQNEMESAYTAAYVELRGRKAL